jgi:hypothetical protein
MSDDAVVIGGIAIGFVVLPWLAGVAPELVNGLLLLLIIGAVLLNSPRWLPYLTQFGSAAGKASEAAPNTRHGDQPT